MIIIQPTTETSVVARAVASAVRFALITKDVPAVIVEWHRCPRAAAPVAPTVCLQTTMREAAVTAVVATVAVPPTKVTLPKELAPAVVVVATLVERILLPAVPKTRFPFVAVIAPRVAVTVVPAVTEVPAATEPSVALMFPAEATMLPVVDVIPVPAVTVVVATIAVPDVIVVVEAIVPGAINVVGMLKVIECPPAEPVEVSWFAVPRIEIFPANGLIAPPLPPVRVVIAPVVPEPRAIQFPEPGHMKAALSAVSNHNVPFT